ncbi:MAG: undecaprenyldiphospho-muramoylpentapeptide beta-N-acetylglucosaminyltransferase [Gammaproteobacteria bacterium]|nr:MAG: undecaprenyldiphospho-muramoylpentapeptide beta-N-acetylglucosaminyltransferase [Gammaproteobacteria bacterium]RLA11540.1 MAG: undecaprenyldiphospho-muramoylpentapeptide beta-N-acetylglucosaminyltransferase [Gammaproteobacteria bacterium]
MSRVLIMAGGTGGHVIPGLAVAEVLRRGGTDVCWLGTAAGIEARLVPAAGISLHTIASKGLRGGNWLRIVLAPFMLIHSLWQALVLLRRVRPSVVLGMGGYAAGPGGLAAWLMRVPLVVHEQNRVTGLTNRLLRPLARVMMYGFPQTVTESQAIKVKDHGDSTGVVVGNPVGRAIEGASTTIRRESGPTRILVLGGSQGARALNQAVAEFCIAQNGNDQYEIWHQCGTKLLDETRALYSNDHRNSVIGSGLRLDGFIDDMAAAYHWADLVIARAGALTISELCLAHKPSILVPLPTAVGDHQTANANYLTEQNAAILLPQSQLSIEALSAAIESLADADRRQVMADAAGELARPDAAQRVAETCLEWRDA